MKSWSGETGEAPLRLTKVRNGVAPDGSASLLDAVSRAAEVVNSPHYPMPCSVIAPTKEERDSILSQRHVRLVVDLARSAEVTFVSIGSMAEDAPLVRDAFATLAEVRAMIAAGSAGEFTGWA